MRQSRNARLMWKIKEHLGATAAAPHLEEQAFGAVEIVPCVLHELRKIYQVLCVVRVAVQRPQKKLLNF